MVKVLKSEVQRPHCDISSSNRRDVCFRVGINTQILTVEDSESHGQESSMPSYSGLDTIPGLIPESDDAECHSESYLLSSVTVISTKEERSH